MIKDMISAIFKEKRSLISVKKDAIGGEYGIDKGYIFMRPHHLNYIFYFDLVKTLVNESEYDESKYAREIEVLGANLHKRGYSEEHIENTMRILRGIQENRDIKIKIVSGLDSICSACNKESTSCDTDILVSEDLSEAEKYGLELSKTYNINELRTIFRKN